MFSTAYPQLIDILVICLTLLINVPLTVISIRQFNATRDRLRDVETTKLDIADLADRFTGFQKRDGMRKVRADRTTEADLLAEVKSLAVGDPTRSESGQTDVKAALRRKLRASH